VARRPSNFRQQDVTRAINAAIASGLSIARVEVDAKTAKITVIIGDAKEEAKSNNPWDDATMTPIGKRKQK
jgi:hypothetical protein